MTKWCAPNQFPHASFRKLRRIRSFFSWAVWCCVFLISISKDTNSAMCKLHNICFLYYLEFCILYSNDGTILSICTGSQIFSTKSSERVFLTTPYIKNILEYIDFSTRFQYEQSDIILSNTCSPWIPASLICLRVVGSSLLEWHIAEYFDTKKS